MAQKTRSLATSYRIGAGRRFKLREVDPASTLGWKKEAAKARLERARARLAELQEKLYAQNSWALLVIFQAMDAAGKDSVIEHVMSGVNPQGCEVHSFKAPSGEELDHEFMWRTTKRVPERGRIGIFNRSYYEEVLVVRVHPEWLANQHLPPPLVTKNIWKERFEDIVSFERYLSRNGIVVRKFFLHVSPEEQRRRFLARLERPEKNWKFQVSDIQERELFPHYMHAYEDMIQHTSTSKSPWYVVPADNKWFTRLVVAEALVETLESLNLAYPRVDRGRRREIVTALAALRSEENATVPKTTRRTKSA